MEYGSNARSSADSMPYHVIAAPSVIVDPMVVGVYIRQDVMVECRLTSDPDDTSGFQWFKDGQLVTADNEGLSHHLPQRVNKLKTKCVVLTRIHTPAAYSI